MRCRLLILALFAAVPASAPAEPIAAFHSIQLRSGGEVIVRHGRDHRIEVTQGDRRRTRIAVAGGRLEIDNCPDHCRGHARMRIEVTAPRLGAIAVDSGGRIVVERGFPAQDAVAAAVSNGGAIDIRRLDAARVTAAVSHGGTILTRPGRDLQASVAQGGAVTYWGNPEVRRSVQRGGVIGRGRPADADRPLVDLGPRPPALPPIPPLPPVPRLGD